MFVRNLLLSVVTILIFSPESFGARIKKNANVACGSDVMGQLDHYLKEVEILSGKRRFPETMSQLKEACKINKNIMSILTNLANKCMTGFKKNVMQVTLYSVKKSHKSLCRSKPNKEMKDLIAAGKCVNSGISEFSKCARTTRDNVLRITRAQECLRQKAKNVPQCTEEHIETIQKRFNRASMNGMNIACGDYTDETDKCDKVHAPKDVIVEQSNKTMVMTMFELLDGLPLDDNIPI
ncbi:hypothetical protein BLOT_003237 [Blomia tropicalis]|nr:hypothetical protein BLOT_003237 [Blomia tropicalis]